MRSERRMVGELGDVSGFELEFEWEKSRGQLRARTTAFEKALLMERELGRKWLGRESGRLVRMWEQMLGIKLDNMFEKQDRCRALTERGQ
jgi:hypothetical protein